MLTKCCSNKEVVSLAMELKDYYPVVIIVCIDDENSKEFRARQDYRIVDSNLQN